MSVSGPKICDGSWILDWRRGTVPSLCKLAQHGVCKRHSGTFASPLYQFHTLMYRGAFRDSIQKCKLVSRQAQRREDLRVQLL
jgi:hypothetical protein